MKTVSRLIRRYIFSAFGIVLLIFFVNISLFLGIVIHFGSQQEDIVRIGKFAANFSRTPDGTILPDTALDWQSRFAWAMLLDDGGHILWSESLPGNLHHVYTVPEVASFSRWYLDDYPVMVYRNGFGLLVAGLPRDSLTRFDFYMENDLLEALLSGFGPLLLVDIGLILAACLLLGWHASLPLREAGEAIDRLAEGESVELKETGATAELAQKLNRTGERLRRQSELITRRDAARTNWIAGVSHDIRTPMALILGYAEQLERASSPDSVARRKAAGIRVQCRRIKELIEDLNLTSKLQYDAQPLRLKPIQIGPMLRRCLAAFCDTLDEQYEVNVSVSEKTERLMLPLDVELMIRAIDNLLNNSVRHNPQGCAITVSAESGEGALHLMVRDNGAGYPVAVLRELRGEETQEEGTAPHILGLYLVRQIAEAHGGAVQFFNHAGAVSVVTLHYAE